jgi:hypothetical protein
MKQKGDYLPEYIGGKCPVMKEYAIEQSKTNNRQLQRKHVKNKASAEGKKYKYDMQKRS